MPLQQPVDVDVTERFWTKVQIGADCWEWIGSKGNYGYGRLFYRSYSAPVRAHVLSWVIHFGAVPQGLCVLHKCDNPPCVNPDHLFLGTKKDNTQDMVSKGRARGAARKPCRFCGGPNPKGQMCHCYKAAWMRRKRSHATATR